MTNLIGQIQNNRVAFRKDSSKDAEYSILTLLVGELETASKRDGSSITDEKVVAAARKLIKSNTETHKLKPSLKLIKENECLEKFLPQQMSEEQLRSEIQNLNTALSFKNIGEVMAELNKIFPGQFDKGTASKVARELFQ